MSKNFPTNKVVENNNELQDNLRKEQIGPKGEDRIVSRATLPESESEIKGDTWPPELIAEFTKESFDIKKSMEANNGRDPLWHQRKFNHSQGFVGNLPDNVRNGHHDIGDSPGYVSCGGIPSHYSGGSSGQVAEGGTGVRTAREHIGASIAPPRYKEKHIMMVDPKSGRCVPVREKCPGPSFGAVGALVGETVGKTTAFVKDEFGFDPTPTSPGCVDVESKQEKKYQEEAPTRAAEAKKRDQANIKQYQFHEQCFIMQNYKQFIGTSSKSSSSTATYKNFVQVFDEKPEVFYNTLVAAKGMGSFVGATPKELSELVPYIKIWKVYYPNGQDAPGVEIELPMKNFLSDNDVSEITKNQGDRGSGIGIESFSWDMSGVNPAEAMRLISANLVIYFQDINSLVGSKTIISGGRKYEVSFLDLIYMETKGDKRTWDDGAYNKIIIEVGWSTREDSRLYGTIKKTRNSFILSHVMHDVDFKDDATVSLSMKLQALPEAILESPKADVLLDSEGSKILVAKYNEKKIEARSVKSKAGWTKQEVRKIQASGWPGNTTGWGENCLKDPEDINSDINKIEDCGLRVLQHKLQTDRVDKYSQLLCKIEEGSVIHYADIPQKDILEWNVNNTPISIKIKKGVTDLKVEDALKETKSRTAYSDKRETRKSSGETVTKITAKGDWNMTAAGDVRIHYIFLGSILEAALSYLPGTELRNIVGTVEMIDTETLKTTTINIAEIPISFDLFKLWFYRACVKEQLNTWSLSRFLNSLANTLFTSLYKSCLEQKKIIYGRPQLSLRAINLPLNSDAWGAPTCSLTGQSSVKKTNAHYSIFGPKPFINGEPDRSSSRAPGQYFYIGVENQENATLFAHPNLKSSRRIRDEKRGIYHLNIGQGVGLVKNIKFQKMDDPALLASRIHSQGMTGLGGVAQLYNAEVEMVGNNLFWPGSYVFIDTTGVSKSRINDGKPLSFKLGFGGYYMITSVKSSIKSGEFVTNLTCIYQSSGFTERP